MLGAVFGAAAGIVGLALTIVLTSYVGTSTYYDFAVVGGPAWLAPALGVLIVVLCAGLGAGLASTASSDPVRAALIGVLAIFLAVVCWVGIWTLYRLVASGESGAWGLVIELPLISAAGMLIACVVVVPVAFAWSILTGSASKRLLSFPRS